MHELIQRRKLCNDILHIFIIHYVNCESTLVINEIMLPQKFVTLVINIEVNILLQVMME